MKNIFLLVSFLAFSLIGNAQGKDVYKLYNENGKKVRYQKMLRKIKKADVVLVGEFHNNPISHWLEYSILEDISENNKVTIGMEMFETDTQTTMDAFLEEKLTKKEFDSLARPWNNFDTDYLQLIEFSKKNNIPVIATNVPRKYASIVYKKGFEGLETLAVDEKKWIAPLPIPYDKNLPGYQNMLKMMGGHGGENLPKAQALKDATMANSILKNKKEGELFIHFNGSYHSDDFEGIYWYLKKHNPELNIVTISIVEQKEVNKFKKENKEKADFILVVDEDVTKSY
ncbi:ChaN family lipoprotein [Aureivirga sp. CE67]|uniref:ChaN family lipoprotein n=1 Tax=Aureivirga sp. CE67 TaxID=1788983 RepID=UPI0018CB953F|nr:ChaN family lipoprotein [Aureivirga sp. CE67]